ncbi:MAG TPA: nucleoside deaminase [Saprospiraceae bacterium]|nr:nucleoside deaminase [Saprospiraceae bacterium]
MQVNMNQDEFFIREAIRAAENGMNSDEGGPFGCVIVRDGVVVGRGNNRVTSTNDPTAHAEVVAIRDACRQLGHFQLEGCTLYTSCEPCPMCLGAIYWARPDRIVYAATRHDAAGAGFSDEFIYTEFDKPLHARSIPIEQLLRDEAMTVFESWRVKADKIVY